MKGGAAQDRRRARRLAARQAREQQLANDRIFAEIAELAQLTDFAVTAAAEPVLWDSEDGVMDVMSDISAALNPGDSWRWWVVDLALNGALAILCDSDAGEYWLAPVTIGDDREPVLSAQTEWTAVESAWIKANPSYAARITFLEQSYAMSPCDNCSHAYTSHLGTEGPCTAEDCTCTGYQAPADAAVAPTQPFQEKPVTVPMTLTPIVTQGGDPAGFWISNGITFTDGSFDVGSIPAALETLPPPNPSPAAPEPMPVESGEGAVKWSATIAPEGALTSDGRAFAPGAITWRDLPLSLGSMKDTPHADVVTESPVCGRIDQIWRDGNLLRATGVFDSGEIGQDIARLVADGFLTGVSVDLAVNSYEVGPRSDFFDDEGNWAPKDPEATSDEGGDSLLDLLFGSEDSIFVVTDGTIGAVTVCPFPAFAEATIKVGDSMTAGANPAVWSVTSQAGWQTFKLNMTIDIEAPAKPALTASAAGLVADVPSVDFFADPLLEELTPLTITDEGHVYGHAAAWDTCHIGVRGACTTAPSSHSDYAYFHLKEVLTDDGSRISCGTITLDTGHAGTNLSRADATYHYDHTGAAVVDVVVGEDEWGIWFSGALRADADAETVQKLRGAVLSGDWRDVNGDLEMVALLAVNVPGFPVPRQPRAVVASAGGDMHTLTLLSAGLNMGQAAVSKSDRAKFKAIASEAAGDFDELVEA